MDNPPKLSLKQKLRIAMMAFRHPRMTFSMVTSSERSIKNFVNHAEKLTKPVLPSESSGKPMTEGMIYILFSTDESETPINSVYRLFWVDAPILKIVKLDSFLISEDPAIGPRQFENVLERSDVFKQGSRRPYSKIIEEDGFLNLKMEGSIEEGYSLVLKDELAHLEAELAYSVIPNGVLNYYGGKPAISKMTHQKFYDIFGMKVQGNVTVDGKTYKVNQGRGIIEQSTGIFSTGNLSYWNWMNFQYGDGAIHIFQLVLDLGEEELDATQGAISHKGEWEHFVAKEIKITIQETETKEDAPCEIPLKWKVETPTLKLKVKSEMHYYWTTFLPGEKQYIADYVLSFEGTYNNEPINGKGTAEFLFSEKI